MKNNGRAGIREVYQLIEDMRKEFNARIDNLENNHIQHLSDRITALEIRVWMGIGVLAAITFLIRLAR